MFVVVMSFRPFNDCITGPLWADAASGQDSERAMAAERMRFVMCFPGMMIKWMVEEQRRTIMRLFQAVRVTEEML
jgi:hypothetical protein